MTIEQQVIAAAQKYRSIQKNEKFKRQIELQMEIFKFAKTLTEDTGFLTAAFPDRDFQPLIGAIEQLVKCGELLRPTMERPSNQNGQWSYGTDDD